MSFDCTIWYFKCKCVCVCVLNYCQLINPQTKPRVLLESTSRLKLRHVGILFFFLNPVSLLPLGLWCSVELHLLPHQGTTKRQSRKVNTWGRRLSVWVQLFTSMSSFSTSEEHAKNKWMIISLSNKVSDTLVRFYPHYCVRGYPKSCFHTFTADLRFFYTRLDKGACMNANVASKPTVRLG